MLAFTKFLRMWNVWPNADDLSNRWIRTGVAISFVPVTLLGLWGVYRFGLKSPDYAICWLPIVYFTLLHMVFVGSIRYRQPAMLCLIIFASAALTAWRRTQPLFSRTHDVIRSVN